MKKKKNIRSSDPRKVERKGKKRKRKKKSKLKLFLSFIVFEIIFSLLTGPFMLYYGPFKNVKTTVVGSAMTTMNHQYIATLFLSDKKINEILNGQEIEEISNDSVVSEVKLPAVKDDTIERYDISTGKFTGYMLVVKDPTRMKVGHTAKLGKEGQLTSEIARNNNAVAAINGGGFPDESQNYTGTGAVPTGIIITNGEVVYKDPGCENVEYDVMAFNSRGEMIVGKHTLIELQKLKVKEALTFGPTLVSGGKGTIKSGDGGWGIAPRTAIGQRADGAILLIVIDGRKVTSLGATLKDVQNIMLENGAVNAINLDGGSSSTMFYNDEVINNPPNSLGERAVPSIVYVK